MQFEILNSDSSVNSKARKLIKAIFLWQICRRIHKFMSHGLILMSCGNTLCFLQQSLFFMTKRSKPAMGSYLNLHETWHEFSSNVWQDVT